MLLVLQVAICSMHIVAVLLSRWQIKVRVVYAVWGLTTQFSVLVAAGPQADGAGPAGSGRPGLRQRSA